MKFWTIYHPGEYGQNIQETFSEDQILASYFDYWKDKMLLGGKEDKISKENCIRDWVTIHWAANTDKFGGTLWPCEKSLQQKP